MGLFSSDYNDTSSGYWSADHCAEGPDFYKEEKKKVKKVERSRHDDDDDDDDYDGGMTTADADMAANGFMWLMGISLLVNFWYIIIPAVVIYYMFFSE